jgi:hypothetical protein
MTSSIKRMSPGLWFSLFLIAGCASNGPTAPTTDFISLTSIAPAAGTALNAGDRVTFTAVVTCTIVNSDGGFTAMVIQDQANRTLRVEEEMQSEAPLAKGTTTVTLSQTIKVPVSGSTVTVALPIFVNESTSTRAVVTRQYTVR